MSTRSTGSGTAAARALAEPQPTTTPAVADYTFTEAERQYFGQMISDFTRITNAINQATGLICVQQGLQGQWTVRADGSGLSPVPTQTQAPPQQVNGLASG